MKYKNFELDKFQEDAIKAIENNESVVVSAPTGSGKTLIADYIINKDIENNVRVFYTAPIKALSNEKYKQFKEEYGEENVGLVTGDVSKNPDAKIVVMTTEIYRNMVLSGEDPQVSYVIFDEIHYINDPERGTIWEESVIFSPKSVRFLCLSATIPNAQEFASWIESINEHRVVVVSHDKRNVPLHKEFYDSLLGITNLKKIQEDIDLTNRNFTKKKRPRVPAPKHVELVKLVKKKVPMFFFCFSRKKCQDFALELHQQNLFEQDQKIITFFNERLSVLPAEVKKLPSTKLLSQTLKQGIGFHHAGLLPSIKDIVEDLFSKGWINVLYTTETFAVGINMPTKTVCFEGMRKYDGRGFRFLNSKEYFQIAGRAGRRGIDPEGFVYSMIDRRDFDYSYLHKITTKDIEPIKSQFKLSVNTLLNLVHQHSEDEIDFILQKNFHTFQSNESKRIKTVFTALKRKLTKLEFINEDMLTEKGVFASQIYADEILTSEIFATDMYKDLSEYDFMLLIGCLCYEPREKTEVYKTFTRGLKKLQESIWKNLTSTKFDFIEEVTTFIHPIYHGESLFEVMKLTNLLEGDLIRFYRQMIDRIRQIKHATPDAELRLLLENCQNLVLTSLQDLDEV